MLKSMSLFYQKDNFDLFFKEHKQDKESIFEEIYSFLGNQEFKAKKDFKKAYTNLLLKEKNREKILSSGLVLKIDTNLSNLSKLILIDKENRYKLDIEFIKKVRVLNKKSIDPKIRYIISYAYFKHYYQINQKMKIKYKLKNDIEELSFSSDNLENEIIYNTNIEYISIYPNFKNIYDNIFEIIDKEKSLTTIDSNNFFNKYRLLLFPNINKEDINKIKFKRADLTEYDWDYKYFAYNRKTGITFNIQRILIEAFQMNKKYFYLNMDFLYNEENINNIGDYIFFNLAFLFSLDKKNEFIEFIENNILNFIYVYKGEKLIDKLLSLLFKKFGNNFRLYIDDVKSEVQLKIIKNLMDKYGIKDIIIYVQINERTLISLIEFRYKLIENDEIGSSINDEFDFYIPLSLNKININEIKNFYKKKLRPFFEKFDYETYLHLLKVKYLIYTQNVDIYKLIYIDSLLEFLYVKIGKSKVYETRFRNDVIEDIFNDYYINYISKFNNNNNNIFFELTKSEEGINLERQIIYDLIIKKININKIKVKKIFSIKFFPEIEFNKNEEYLFIQEAPNAPYYDFAYLYNSDGFIILKVGQIGINKNMDDLIKLDKEFLLFDLYYFAQKLKFEKGIKIDKIELCLITTYNAFEENVKYLKNEILKDKRKYNCFQDMKQFCNENDFIFLIFDTQFSDFYRYNNKNVLIKTDLKYDAFQFDVIKIFKKTKYIEGTKKINYYYKPKDAPNIIGKIKLPSDFKNEYLNSEFNFERTKERAIYKRKMEIEIDDIQKENIIDKKGDVASNKKKKQDKFDEKEEN